MTNQLKAVSDEEFQYCFPRRERCFRHCVSFKKNYFKKDKFYRLIGLMSWVLVNGPGDLGSILGRVIPKTLKMVFDTSLLNPQQNNVCIKGKVEQSRERSSAPPTSRCCSYWKESLLVALDYDHLLLSL